MPDLFSLPRRHGVAALLLASALGFSSVVGGQPYDAPGRTSLNGRIRDCTTVNECIEAMRGETAINGGYLFQEKFPSFGPAAIRPLMDLLAGDDPKMRRYAAQALWLFPSIGEEWLPLLLREDAAGDSGGSTEGAGWLSSVIGRVGSDAALSYLFDRLAEKPGEGMRNHVGPAILRNGKERILPHVRSRLEGFPPDGAPEYLSSLVQMSSGGNTWTAPQWVAATLAKIASQPEFSGDLRAAAEYALRPFGHDIALHAQLREFRAALAHLESQQGLLVKPAEYVPLQWGDWHYEISAFDRYGLRARDAGPMIATFLTRADYPAARAAAALTVGRIGYTQAVAALIELRVAFDDDWVLAYQAVESLGRLKAAEARPLLHELAASHWHSSVRANALRALNFLEGGRWERPGIANDGALLKNDHPTSPLRYAGDEHERPAFMKSACSDGGRWREHPARISQAPIGKLPWPKRGWLKIEPRGNTAGAVSKKLRTRLGRGQVTVVEPLRSGGMLVGTSAGEFIGALDHIDEQERIVRLLTDNVSFAFHQAGRLFVLTGLSHLGTSEGTLWEIDTKGPIPQVIRRIPLPSEAQRIILTDKHLIVFETSEGDVAIDASGRTVDLSSAAVCGQS